MIKVGHASISEKGTVNGTKGDQTGKEVCIREWWDKGWDAVLRPISLELAEKSAKACEDGCKIIISVTDRERETLLISLIRR